MIEVTNLTKKYGRNTAVSNISFTINKGQVVGFLGPNGAGKTTTMNILTGYLSPTGGQVKIDGFDILEEPRKAKAKLGFLPEHPPLYLDMTPFEYLCFIYDLKKVKAEKAGHINEICGLVKISGIQNRLIKKLSKGYRQRVGIAAALIGNPDVLILDEPTVGLDPNQIIEIRNLIRSLSENHTIILSSHILSEIQAVCKRVLVINNGEIVADDTPENLSELMSDDKTLVARIVGDRDRVLPLINSLPGVALCEFVSSPEKGSGEYKITPAGNEDIRIALFEALAKNNFPLILLKTNKLTLEEVFIRLTSVDETQYRKQMNGKEGNS